MSYVANKIVYVVIAYTPQKNTLLPLDLEDNLNNGICEKPGSSTLVDFHDPGSVKILFSTNCQRRANQEARKFRKQYGPKNVIIYNTVYFDGKQDSIT